MRNFTYAFLASPFPLRPARPRPPSASTVPLRAAPSASSISEGGTSAPPVYFAKKIPKPEAVSSTYTCLVSSAPPRMDGVKARTFRPSPELGLLSLLFVLSMAIGSIFCMAIVSIPTMTAFRRLAASMEDLSKVASEELPGTLSSLRLSMLEVNELTRQLSNLRQKIPGSRRKKGRVKKNECVAD
ncbi:uncharacterized protein LOC116208837 [Punica granatum]|uniref:Uncharacterized protein LOC116208837 n=2 Tax=Punica granatum TaxID=22663 RepID=A0A6P8DQC7_PUNGR|nr:uncharacterized protein LOC116208837 [Punica granatum]PKI43060.1 hypothetical protein CRG98_036539 [Punica granatum]